MAATAEVVAKVVLAARLELAALGASAVSVEPGAAEPSARTTFVPARNWVFAPQSPQAAVSEAELNLGRLQDNGGPTQTHALNAGSVAIDLIPAAQCVDADDNPLTVDQRGELRPGGMLCDAGAFEAQP